MESCTQLKHLQFCVTSKTSLDCWTSNQGSYILFLSVTHKNTVGYFAVEKLVKKTAPENSHNTREATFLLNQHHFRAAVLQFKALFHVVLKKKKNPSSTSDQQSFSLLHEIGCCLPCFWDVASFRQVTFPSFEATWGFRLGNLMIVLGQISSCHRPLKNWKRFNGR